MNDNERILFLMQLIRVDGNIEHLRSLGWSYIDVLSQLDRLSGKGLLIQKEYSYKLSSSGEKYFQTICRNLRKRGLYKYFSPDYTERTSKLSEEDIYIPRKGLKL